MGTRTHTRHYTHGQTPTGMGSGDTHTRVGTDCRSDLTKSVMGDPYTRSSKNSNNRPKSSIL